MATCLRYQPKWVGSTLNATCPWKRGGPEDPGIVEAASQSYGVDDMLFLSSGKLTICTVNGSNQSDSAILGFADEAATGVTDTQRRVHVIRPDDIWAMNVFHATPASAVLTQAMIGTVRGIVKTTVSGNGTNIWSVDIENSVEGAADALARVKIVGYELRSLVLDANSVATPGVAVTLGTDLYIRAYVRFLEMSHASDGNPNQRILQF
jgi:hypothetical protein